VNKSVSLPRNAVSTRCIRKRLYEPRRLLLKNDMDTPQNAEIIEQKDTGDEVSSTPKIDPLLVHCAVIMNEPVQTEDLTKFAEGADPRGLCG